MSVFKSIPPEDQTITPFKVYKSWEYTGTSNNKFSELTSQSIFLLTAIKPNPSNFSNGLMSLDYDLETATDLSTDLLNSTYKFIPAGVVWHSLKHQYFNDYNGQINFGGHAKPRIKKADNLELWSGTTFKADVPSTIKSYNYIEHVLNPSGSCELQSCASIISIPQLKFGEEIKPGSIQITCDSNTYGIYTLTDDSNGNLIDSSISPAFKLSNKIIQLGFDSGIITENPIYPAEITSYNTYISSSFVLNGLNIPYGQSIYLSESYVRIDGTPSYLNPRTLDNYAVSFWFKVNTVTPGHGRNSHLVSKRSLARNYQLIDPSGHKKSGNIWRPNNKITPYDIYVNRSGKLQAQVGDGSTLLTLSSAGTISPNTTYHVAFQKSGSVYQLYLNGTLQESDTASLVSINNDADIFIGCKGLDIHDNNRPFAAMYGSIDEIQYYNTYLTTSEISQLNNTSDNIFNSPNVGKIFYKEGMIIISSPNPKFGSISNNSTNKLFFQSPLYKNSTSTYITAANTIDPNTITIAWNSTLTLYENEILCRINEEEFNFTLNPSIAQDSENGQLPKEFIYNDEFGPYITTIGLYNENAELLAIGKLAGPIKKRSNVDLNIIVRFDQ